METLIHAVQIYSKDTGMKFSIEKSAILLIKSWKQLMAKGMELQNQEKIRTLGAKQTYKYLGI